MSAARRSLLTATAAASVLGALWFVPSANATADLQEQVQAAKERGEAMETHGTAVRNAESRPADGAPRLAETGAETTTPYLVGGSLLVAAGLGFVAYSVRRAG